MKAIQSLSVAAALLLSTVAGLAAAEIKGAGLTVGSLGNPFFAVVQKGVEDGVSHANPKAKVVSVSAEYDLNKQFNQIDNFVTAGQSVIFINAVDPNGIAPAVKRAQAAGVPVIAIGDNAAGADAVVAINNLQAGERACQFIVDKLGGKGNVLIINGPQVSAVVARVQGCKEVFAKAPGIKILSEDQDGKGSRDGGFAVTQTLLTRFPTIDAIFAINDPTAIGAELAAKQLQRTSFFITAVDGSPDIEVSLKDKNSLILASASQDPFVMATKAVEIGQGILNGKKPENPSIQLESVLVTRDTVGAYKGWTSPR
jgi:ribose transport system substrate-binding protein